MALSQSSSVNCSEKNSHYYYSSNWNDRIFYIPHFNACDSTPLFTRATSCPTCLHTFFTAVFTSFLVSVPHLLHNCSETLFVTSHIRLCPYMSSNPPTATVSTLSFQRQKERKKLEREEKIEDVSEQVRCRLYELMYSIVPACMCTCTYTSVCAYV